MRNPTWIALLLLPAAVFAAEEPGKVGEHQVLEGAGFCVQVQQAARAALRNGVLGDEFWRQLVVEL